MTGLTKQPISINFAGSMDTKTDPWQLDIGQFLLLQNVVYDEGKNLLKRNGFGQLTLLPSEASQIVGYRDNLIALGDSLLSYSAEADQWSDRGYYKCIGLDTLALARVASGLTTVDAAVSDNDLVCTAFLDGDGSYKYQVSSLATGEAATVITSLPSGALSPRVFVLSRHFVVTFLVTVTATPTLRYIAIPLNNPTNPGSATSLSSSVSSTSAGYDGVVANNTLFLAWDGSAGGGEIRGTSLTSSLVQGLQAQLSAGRAGNYVSVCADTSGSTAVIYVTYYATADSIGYTLAVTPNLDAVLAPTASIASSPTPLVALTSVATAGVCTHYFEISNTYAGGSVRSDYINTRTITVAGVAGTASTIARSVGLASKAFTYNGATYMLAAYAGAQQPSYFLIDSTGRVVGRLAYSNGGGYVTVKNLPGVSLQGNVAHVGYLYKDLLAAVNREAGVANVNGVYSQAGANLASWTMDDQPVSTVEIGECLHLSGGQLWMYDGIKPVEHGFHVYPEDITAVVNAGAGSMAHQLYYYQVVYEWTDGQGNIHRSAPSIPVGITLVSDEAVDLQIPTLRLTYKDAPNKVRIVIYRWSTAQQNYYRVTSITSPTLNVTTQDTITYTDTLADASILGNDLIYTTGGVVENIAAPAPASLALYNSRLMLIDSEDKDNLWFSKQVIQTTPVEMSDLFTQYAPPTTGATRSTGKTRVLAPMDDKLVSFKSNAIYYRTGSGPNNLGENNNLSEPVFITSAVGCENPDSVVLSPLGLFFQANGGIWLLGRDLSIKYIGAEMEVYTSSPVLSAISVPSANHVRFTLASGKTLIYDYYYSKWGVFSGIPGISSVVVNGLHTYLDDNSTVFQETPGSYLDGSAPVLISVLTGWINPAGLQGYVRSYFFYLLGKYYSPHKLQLAIAYDYNPSPEQSMLVTPTNYAVPYGSEDGGDYGQGGSYGGPGDVEQWRVFLRKQRCSAFQLTITEVFDPSIGAIAGAGLSLSGLNLVVGLKKGYKPSPASQSIG